MNWRENEHIIGSLVANEWPHVFMRGSSGGGAERKRKIPMHRISLREADGYAIHELDLFVQKLQALGVLDERYMYHAFHPSRLKLITTTGTPHRQNGPRANEIFCLSARDIEQKNPNSNLLEYIQEGAEADQSNDGIFAIYHKDLLVHFEKGTPVREGDEHFRFKYPENKLEALQGLVRVDNCWGS